MDGNLQRVCPADAIEPGGMLRFAGANGKPIALYNVDGAIYATDDRCTHGASSLTDEGYLEAHTIECGRHGGAFDVRTGAAVRTPCFESLATYPVTVRDGDVYVDAGAPDPQS